MVKVTVSPMFAGSAVVRVLVRSSDGPVTVTLAVSGPALAVPETLAELMPGAQLPVLAKLTVTVVLAPTASGPTLAHVMVLPATLVCVGLALLKVKQLSGKVSVTVTVGSAAAPLLVTWIWNCTGSPTLAVPSAGLTRVLLIDTEVPPPGTVAVSFEVSVASSSST